MKRSEMLEAIELRLSEISYAEDVNQKKFEGEDIAKKLLDYIEGLGMLPPGYQSEFWSRSDNDFYIVNEWEEEDEKK